MTSGKHRRESALDDGLSMEFGAATATNHRKFTDLPPIFVSATHFDTEELHQLEDDLSRTGANITYDINEAVIVLSKVTKTRRIQFDLRAKGLWTEEIKPSLGSSQSDFRPSSSVHLAKRQKINQRPENPGENATQAIVIDDDTEAGEATVRDPKLRHENRPHLERPRIIVLKMDWLYQSEAIGHPLSFDNFVSFQGFKVEKPSVEITLPSPSSKPRRNAEVPEKPGSNTQILERARDDAVRSPNAARDHFGQRRFNLNRLAGSKSTWAAGRNKGSLLQQTTTDNDDGSSSELPEMPEWVKAGTKYACQRSTPKTSPNDHFISLLKKIKLARLLTNDEIGVRAYSTSIASLAAYPYKITVPREIVALPGCDAKIANLYVEWINTGTLKAVSDIEANPELKVLELFYHIWGVGATTAREFYFERGWKDLDDIVEFGWSGLTRVQQIGVKFYDEFLDLIPRAEVESIAKIIHRHAVNVRDDQIQTLLVGGFRRGKEACGDVDIIVSHPDEEQTASLVNDIVTSLEDEGWITHTLLLSLKNTNRDQQTLPFRSGGGGHGFDSLDKALVVWQNPTWDTRETDLATDPKAKNPNIHRRVDIIVSPWRTVGCAIVGWSGGTTFERDLRRYAKTEFGYKFDSSGVRSRVNGEVVDLEGYYDSKRGRAETMLEAERRVFEGLKLEYREPEQRCTG
ncbi:Hypothetical protein R9X50_00583400 [Acrodontium crateriforme]|uniref:DNA polymerase n=1 Tax=Acrodontium crateriforme TaxID=150365 RepID=A0AAQ3M8J9_9PEZI|nr:Hypothetical protein R9X50_00583400 [Acrodontium crateriforme]